MSTLAWVLILAAVVIGRQVAKGRALNLPEDLSDAFLAFAQGDSKQLASVFSRTGDSNTATQAAEPLTSNVSAAPASGLANAALALGGKAKGYRWGSAGPDYYDCSGLMYRAAQKVGYKGPRFTTATVLSHKQFRKISPPATQGPGLIAAGVNDIVLWPAGSGGITGHMGVITGNNTFYSAMSRKSGIGSAAIDTFRSTPPVYVRFTG